MDDNGETKDDIKLPDGDLGKKIAEQEDDSILVTILTAIGEEAAVGTKAQSGKD